MAVTIKDIAAKLGVAPSTVSNVLNGRYKGSYPKTVARAERIKSYAAKRGYRPSAAARAVRAKRTYQVGVLLPNRPGHPHTHPSAFEGVLGLNSGLQQTGYIVSIIRFDDLAVNITSHTRLFSEQSLDGLVVFGNLPEWAEAGLEKLVSRIVWMDTRVWREEHCIRRDEAEAGREAVQHVAALGFRRMIWLGYPDEPLYRHYSHDARRSAVLAAAAKAGLAIEEVELKPWGGEDEWRGLEHRLTPDTVVLAESGYHAQILAHHVASMGLTAPRDFGLACCEGSQEIDRLWPGLSRVTFDRFEMGRQASEMLRAMIDQEDQPVPSRVLRGTWVPGDTTKSRSDAPAGR